MRGAQFLLLLPSRWHGSLRVMRKTLIRVLVVLLAIYAIALCWSAYKIHTHRVPEMLSAHPK